MFIHYPVVIHKDTDSDYGVTVPDIPGCFSAGAFIPEALQQAKESIECHLEGLILDNEEIPAATEDHTPLVGLKEFRGGIWHLIEINLNKLDTRTKRINVTIPERTLNRMDRYVKEHRFDSRSGFIAHAVETFIEQYP